jgi:hypothetical protein
MLASFWGRAEVVKLLLAAGADVHKQDEVSVHSSDAWAETVIADQARCTYFVLLLRQ